MTHDPPRQTLRFESDPGAGRALWLALASLVAIAGWMLSGALLPDTGAAGDPVARTGPAPVTVAVRESVAQRITLDFEAEGQAQPDRDTALRIEAGGDVTEVLVEKGADVTEGTVLARLDTTRLEADLARATEDLARAARDFENAEALLQRGVATQDRVAQARATLASARAALAAVEEDLRGAVLTAPFDGRIETLALDPGEFVTAGREVGRIVDLHPLTVSLRVPQRQLSFLRDGQPANVRFITGETRQGVVSFVGTSADAATRTFLAEITLDNRDGTIPAGVSAEITIPVAETLAHFVSPALITLSPGGVAGVKTAEPDGRVGFYPVTLARAEVDGIWITGLPERARLITVGQGFVREGDPVEALREEALDVAGIARPAGTDLAEAGP